MSRIGKSVIQIPEGVKIEISNNKVNVTGPKGSLSDTFKDMVGFEIKENEMVVKPGEECDNAYWGLTRSLVNNMVTGVSKGFEKKLEIVGVGYRAKVGGNTLTLSVGYSHPVDMQIPEGLSVEVKDNTNIFIRGIDKQKLGQFTANVREVRPPEPYKGKGIRYDNEYVRRKVGKTGV